MTAGTLPMRILCSTMHINNLFIFGMYRLNIEFKMIGGWTHFDFHKLLRDQTYIFTIRVSILIYISSVVSSTFTTYDCMIYSLSNIIIICYIC